MRLRPTLRGCFEAAALLLDDGLLGRAEVARRIFALWEPGCRLERTRAGLVLVLARPRRFPAAGAPGLPLLARAGALVGFAAGDALLAELSPPTGAVVVQLGGRVAVIADGRPESPADWLDLGAMAVVSTEGLNDAVPLALEVPGAANAHEVLGPAVPAPAEAREAILREATRQGEGGGEGESEGEGGVRGWLGRLADGASDLLGLHRLLGRRYGRYLGRMMEMLEGGDLREGLRHAIPLASVRDLAARRARRGSIWKVPNARANLTISPARASVGGVGLEETLFARLQQIYRDTFARLDAQGRREEAAFVLAELLQQDEEAVAYLEKHRQLRQAAALAEARRCAPGLVVRAWFLAGDRQRAVRVARERGAFHDAIVRLERTHPVEAKALRFLWADSLADAGDYAGAVAAVHGYPEGRALALGWIDAGIALGEEQAPRLVAFEAALAPERWAATRARAEAWMGAGDARAAAWRRALAEALPTMPASQEAVLLARRCARASLAAADVDPPLDEKTLKTLVRFSGDRALEADLPDAGRRWRNDWRTRAALVATIERGGASAAVVKDAVVLPSGRMLVAHGDAGVALLGPNGSPLHHFDVPADRLIAADAGDRAIALAHRGESAQVSRIDLRARRGIPWGLIRLSRFADSFDGNAWFVTEGQRLIGVDALADEPRAFWSVDGEEDGFASLVRTGDRLVAIAAGWSVERWEYELPGLVLRERTPVRFSAPDGGGVVRLGIWASAGPTTFNWGMDLETRETVLVSIGAQRHEIRWPASGADGQIAGATTPDQWAVALPDGDGLAVRLYDVALAVQAELRLPGTVDATVRFACGHLIVARHDGRLVTLDLDRGTLRTVLPR